MEHISNNINQLIKELDIIIKLVDQFKQNQQKALLNFDEASQYLCVSKSTLYKHTSAGNIAYFKPNGKLILFKREDLDTWINARRIPSNEELLLDVEGSYRDVSIVKGKKGNHGN